MAFNVSLCTAAEDWRLEREGEREGFQLENGKVQLLVSFFNCKLPVVELSVMDIWIEPSGVRFN